MKRKVEVQVQDNFGITPPDVMISFYQVDYSATTLLGGGLNVWLDSARVDELILDLQNLRKGMESKV